MNLDVDALSTEYEVGVMVGVMEQVIAFLRWMLEIEVTRNSSS